MTQVANQFSDCILVTESKGQNYFLVHGRKPGTLNLNKNLPQRQVFQSRDTTATNNRFENLPKNWGIQNTSENNRRSSNNILFRRWKTNCPHDIYCLYKQEKKSPERLVGQHHDRLFCLLYLWTEKYFKNPRSSNSFRSCISNYDSFIL